MRILQVIIFLSLLNNTFGQTPLDTVIHVENQFYRLHVVSNYKVNTVFQVLTIKDSIVLIQDTTEYSNEYVIKQQDCNNDGFPDLIFYADKKCEFVNLLYVFINQTKQFVGIKIPTDLKKDYYTIHSIDGHLDYFYFIKYVLCLNDHGEVDGMNNLYSAILFKINENFKIERIAEIANMDCKAKSRATLYKIVNNKRTYIKSINEMVMDEYLNLVYFNEHFDELIKK